MSKSELLPLLDIIEKIRDPKATQKSRDRKDLRIQGLIIDADDIYEEITHPYSPFLPSIFEMPEQSLKEIAKNIRDDLWNIVYKLVTNKFKPGQEKEFLVFESPAALFDNANNIIYIKGQPGSKHFKVLEALKLKISNELKKRPLNNPTRHFWLPNQAYIDSYNKAEEQLQARYAKEAAHLGHDNKQKAKWLENQRLRGPEFAEVRKIFGNINVRGINLGHGFGGLVSTGARLLENPAAHLPEDLSEIKLTGLIPADFQETIKPILIDLIERDAKAKYERTLSSNKVLGRITLVLPELEKKNKSEGSLGRKDLARIKAELSKLGNYIIGLKGSPSYKDLVSELVEDTFVGKKPRAKKVSTTATKKGKKKSQRVTVNKIKGGKGRGQVSHKKGFSKTPNLRETIGLINSRLHDKIRENMGKGQSKTILNYRTGRFARSAKLKDIFLPEGQKVPRAIVKYMRYPYGTFEPGGRLHLPGRDPHKIFSKSIRQILQEELKKNYVRVNITLKG